MAIIPLGLLTIPSILKLLIKRPGLPGGRFCSEEPPPPSFGLPRSGAKGSRRVRLSRIATGFTEAPSTGLGTSDFAAVTGLVLGGFAAAFGTTDEGPLLAELAAGIFAVSVPAALPFETTVPPEAGFTAGLPAGFGVPVVLAFVAGLEGRLGEEPVAGIVAEDAPGLTVEFVDDAGFGGWACFGNGAAAEGVFAPVAGFAGAAGFNALRTASGVAAGCCAINGVANDANPKTKSQLVMFSFRMTLY